MILKVSFSITLRLCTVLCVCVIVPHLAVTQFSTAKYSRHPGHKLTGHVMFSMTTPDIWTCVLECTETPECLSVNIHKNGGGMLQCELNNNNQHGRGVALQHGNWDVEYIEIVSKQFQLYYSVRRNYFIFHNNVNTSDESM